jgi:AbrB family looped-hinge helix DNA binding protein
MSRITTKGQVTIPKGIRDKFNIKPYDIGKFAVKEGKIIFTIEKGTILDAITKKSNKKINYKKVRGQMEKDIAKDILRKMR